VARPYAIIGCPARAGAYAPDQERAPQALREASPSEALKRYHVAFEDSGDVEGVRSRADKEQARAMSARAAAPVAGTVSRRVSDALSCKSRALILDGDCGIELGTVAEATASLASAKPSQRRPLRGRAVASSDLHS
jgi:arginase